MKRNIPDHIKAARRVSAPLVSINSPDQTATIAAIVNAFKNPVPAVEWDCLRGLRPLTEQGKAAISEGSIDLAATLNPAEMLNEAQKLPGMSETRGGALLFIRNAQRFLGDAPFIQGVANLRDTYKADRRTAVLLGPEIKLPAELAADVITFDEPLPDEAELAEIVTRVHKDSGVAVNAKQLPKIIDGSTGLSSFLAEQTVAMSLGKDGVDVGSLWERKCQAIEQTPGLKVWRGGERFANIGGYAQLKTFLGKYLRGKKAPRIIVYMDEVEKAFAGSEGDTSGVTQDQMGAMLSFMQDNRTAGTLLYGPPGTGKSNIAKAAGAEAETVVIAMDMGALKGSLVGESEGLIRQALKTIKAMGQDRIFFIATCNSMTVLPPALRRRFKQGTFFVDLPTAEERAAIWKLYQAKHDVKGKAGAINDEGWTGAEIETCCEYAESFGCSLSEAAPFIVPVSKSASDVIDGLRRQAHGRYLSASRAGVYVYEGIDDKAVASTNGRRAIAALEE